MNNMCPTCHRMITDTLDCEFLLNIGSCALCDHVYGEVLEEQRREYDRG